MRRDEPWHVYLETRAVECDTQARWHRREARREAADARRYEREAAEYRTEAAAWRHVEVLDARWKDAALGLDARMKAAEQSNMLCGVLRQKDPALLAATLKSLGVKHG